MDNKLNSTPVYPILVLLFTCFVSCKNEQFFQSESFTVSGRLEGLETDFMTRSYKDKNGNRVSDSIFVEENYFSYSAEIDEPSFIFLWPNVEKTIKRTKRGGYYPVKSSQLAFLVSPGDEIVFEGRVTDFIDAYPKGSKSNDDLASINRRIFPLMNQSVNYLLEKENLDENDPRLKIISDSIEFLDNKVIELKKEFILDHPDSEAAAWYLSDMMLRSQISDQEAISAFQLLNSELVNYPFYLEVQKRIKGIEASQIGDIIPDFKTSATLTGDTFVFNDLRGKYVLIDFWGTWCGPCVEEMPKVKEYGEKYKEDLTILGVNQGDSKEKIVDFIGPKGYNWVHLLNGKEADFVLDFNVAGFPTKFIVDREGKILNRFVGDGEDSFAVLDSLLQ